MKKYSKIEIEIINIEDVDVIATSATEEGPEDAYETLITKGRMSQNIDSENVGLFR